jgi:hypothetical protein
MIPTHNSTLGLDIARAASVKSGLPSAIFSLEMSKTEITMRLLSAEARVPAAPHALGHDDRRRLDRLARRMGEVAEAPLYIDDSPNLTMMEIRAKARRLRQRNDLQLIVIDYLQLMSGNKKAESRQQEVSELSRSLKLLAKELEIPVIAMSQLNRGAEQRTDKKPQIADLRESGCLPASTRVLRADDRREVTLGELLAAGARDVPVWSLDDSLRYVRRHLTHVFPTGRKAVFQLSLASGKQVIATANHPFLTYDGWRPLGELTTGSRIAVPRHVPAPDTEQALARRARRAARPPHRRRLVRAPAAAALRQRRRGEPRGRSRRRRPLSASPPCRDDHAACRCTVPAPPGAVPPHPRPSQPGRRLARRPRPVRPALARAVRPGRRGRRSPSASSGCSCATSGPRRLRHRGAGAVAPDGSPTRPHSVRSATDVSRCSLRFGISTRVAGVRSSPSSGSQWDPRHQRRGRAAPRLPHRDRRARGGEASPYETGC